MFLFQKGIGRKGGSLSLVEDLSRCSSSWAGSWTPGPHMVLSLWLSPSLLTFKISYLVFFPFWFGHWWPYNSVVSGQCYLGIFWVGAVNVWLILPEDPQVPQDTLWKWLWACCHSPLDFPLFLSLCDIHPVSLSLTSWTSLSGSYWEQRTWGIWQPAWKGNLALGA